MATLTLGQAAKLTATSKTTLTRSIKSGRLSAIRNDDGSYSIDAAELSRVYKVTPETPETVAIPAPVAHHVTGGEAHDVTGVTVAVMQAQIESLRELLAEVKRSRDDWKGQAERLAITGPSERRSLWRRLVG